MPSRPTMPTHVGEQGKRMCSTLNNKFRRFGLSKYFHVEGQLSRAEAREKDGKAFGLLRA
eukprot:422864-Pelagomonas_calceolata.AAC.1